MVRLCILTLAALLGGCEAVRLSARGAPTKKVVPCPDKLQCCKSCKQKYFCPTTKQCLESADRYAKCDVKACGPTSDLEGRAARAAKKGKGKKPGKGGGPLQENYKPVALGRPLVWNKDPQSLVFFVIGDWGGSSDATPVTGGQKKTAAGMGKVGAEMKPEFVLGLGDNFYPSGVHAHNYWRFKQTYEDVYTHDSLQVPWYHLAGNHDWGGRKSIQHQIEYTTKSPRWIMPGAVYTFVKSLPSGKTARFVMMDSLMVTKHYEFTELQSASAAKNQDAIRGVEWPKGKGIDAWAWFEKQLAASKDDYLFVIDHQPVYTICSHGNTPALSKLPAMMTKYKVSAFLSGHDHCMMHMKHKGNHFILSGASSQAWNVPTWEKATTDLGVDVAYSVHRSNKGTVRGSFNSIELTDTEARIKYFDNFGGVLYEFDDIKPRNL